MYKGLIYFMGILLFMSCEPDENSQSNKSGLNSIRRKTVSADDSWQKMAVMDRYVKDEALLIEQRDFLFTHIRDQNFVGKIFSINHIRLSIEEREIVYSFPDSIFLNSNNYEPYEMVTRGEDNVEGYIAFHTANLLAETPGIKNRDFVLYWEKRYSLDQQGNDDYFAKYINKVENRNLRDSLSMIINEKSYIIIGGLVSKPSVLPLKIFLNSIDSEERRNLILEYVNEETNIGEK